jgi:hypothetical protein
MYLSHPIHPRLKGGELRYIKGQVKVKPKGRRTQKEKSDLASIN